MKNMAILKTLLLCALILLCFVAVHSQQYSTIYEKGVDQANIEIIVNKHNYLRWLISSGKIPGQPKAKNLANLRWDIQLARSAQNIANTLEFKHVRVKDARWSWVGQNLFLTISTDSSKGPNWDEAIQSWFDEYKYFTYPNMSTGETGHYTQVVSSRSKFIGCGYTMYEQDNQFRKLYVCNYGPGGNIIGEPPYEI